jgi:hypothetical protein
MRMERDQGQQQIKTRGDCKNENQSISICHSHPLSKRFKRYQSLLVLARSFSLRNDISLRREINA